MKVSDRLPGIQAVVDRLEAAGYELRLTHSPDTEGVTLIPINNGDGTTQISYHGLTKVSIHASFDGASVNASGYGYCSPRDQFDRVEGTRHAFNRAMHDLSSVIGRAAVKRVLQS